MNTLAKIDKPASARLEGSWPDVLDALANTLWARGTGGLSPAAGLLAWYNWAFHLILSFRQAARSVRKRTAEAAAPRPLCLARRKCARMPDLHRAAVAGSALRRSCLATNVIHQGFLLQQQWWHNATSGVRGVSRHHEDMVTFAGRQWLDMW